MYLEVLTHNGVQIELLSVFMPVLLDLESFGKYILRLMILLMKHKLSMYVTRYISFKILIHNCFEYIKKKIFNITQDRAHRGV